MIQHSPLRPALAAILVLALAAPQPAEAGRSRKPEALPDLSLESAEALLDCGWPRCAPITRRPRGRPCQSSLPASRATGPPRRCWASPTSSRPNAIPAASISCWPDATSPCAASPGSTGPRQWPGAQPSTRANARMRWPSSRARRCCARTLPPFGGGGGALHERRCPACEPCRGTGSSA